MIRSLLALLLLAGAATAIGPAALLLPGPSDVVSLIDALTTKDGKAGVRIKAGKLAGSGKLLVARLRLDVALDQSSRNWRGTVTVRLTVPSEASYVVDLADLKPEHVRFDEAAKTLRIRMPDPKVEQVSPDLSGVKREDKYTANRWRFLDARTGDKMQNALLRHDYQEKARKVAEASAPSARNEARPRVEAFLKTLLEKARPGLAVSVE
ncbi:MAG: DUF4230 domain-containing protein [Gemmataceae bacterium]|nr:DUF4230 domain-containing protein [Gemmataceae bacterium]